MKKLLTLLIAAGLLANSVYAQVEDARERVAVGFKAGVNGSNIYDSQGGDFQNTSKLGFATGVFASLPITKVFGLQPEVLFSQKGFLGNGRAPGGEYTFARTTNYVDIPLLLQFKPNEFLTILVGPQFSYLLSQRDDYRTGATYLTQSQTFRNDDPRRGVLGLSSGVDLNFNHIVVGARGAIDLVNNNGDGTATEPRYKNAYLQVTLGYRFY